MTYKRVIDETASEEIYNDDWFLKDSPSNDTKKIRGSVLKRLMQSGLKEMLTQTEYDALPSTKLSDNVIYYITDTSKIIINGVVYGSGGGGSGSLDAVELTKAQYDALTTEQKNDPTKAYFVTDYNPGGGGASALNDLTDVEVTAPTNGQILQYDGTNSKWINASSGGLNYYLYKGNVGGGASTTEYPTVTLDKPLDAGCYLAILEDQTGINGIPSIYNMTVFSWGANRTSYTIGLQNFQCVLTQTQVQTTQYQGDWRDLFLYIIKIG